MKYLTTYLAVLTVVILACQPRTENPTLDATANLEGTYTGYRSQQVGQVRATDSTQVTLSVTRLSGNRVRILQTAPNPFEYTVDMNNNRFTYDRGLAEASCGEASIKGEGYFENGKLYLRETMTCTRSPALPVSVITVRAEKM